jgi:RNA polymerase sigma factor (TIGR02999 family)
MGDVTRILEAMKAGEEHASAGLLSAVYDELRCLAAQKLSHERPGQTLQATALVHEAWLRLVKGKECIWDSRGHFFSAAAEAMRRILIENARRKSRLKHGGGWERAGLDQIELPSPMRADELLALDEALTELERVDPRGAEVIKLRFFTGLSHPQIAEVLGVCLTTVERSWAFSRVWLYQRIQDSGMPDETV